MSKRDGYRTHVIMHAFVRVTFRKKYRNNDLLFMPKDNVVYNPLQWRTMEENQRKASVKMCNATDFM